MTIDLIVNGEDLKIRAEPAERLAEILRRSRAAPSLTIDCGGGFCGKCLVLLDGKPVASCLVPAFMARGSEVVSYEGFMSTQEAAEVEAALASAGARLCPFCKPAYSLALGFIADNRARMGEEEAMAVVSSVRCTCSDPSAVAGAARVILGGARDQRTGRAHR